MNQQDYQRFNALQQTLPAIVRAYQEMQQTSQQITQTLITALTANNITVNVDQFSLFGNNFIIKAETQFNDMRNKGFIIVYHLKPDAFLQIQYVEVDRFKFDYLGNIEIDENTYRIFIGALMNYCSTIAMPL